MHMHARARQSDGLHRPTLEAVLEASMPALLRAQGDWHGIQ
jgi:hypothetical protein